MADAYSRICSLLPSATEILFALGLGDRVVAVTHECDFPPEALDKPRATFSRIDRDGLTALEIDIAVREHLHGDGTIYQLDQPLLDRLRPDLILTQQLCDVCAVSFDRVQSSAKALGDPAVVSLDPHHLSDVLETILEVGRITDTERRAQEIVDDAHRRLGFIATTAIKVRQRPRAIVLEWLDPPFRAGHWTPEIVAIAGGDDPAGVAGQDATVLDWAEVVDAKPDVIVIAQCGFDLDRAELEANRASWPEGWDALPAVKNDQVFVVDGNSYLSRPGPRIVESAEIVAEILHPGLFGGLAPEGSFRRLGQTVGL